MHRTLESPGHPDLAAAPPASGIACPQHFRQPWGTTPEEEPAARVDPCSAPAPLWVSCARTWDRTHTGHPGARGWQAPAAGTGGTCSLGRKAECLVLAAQDAALTHFTPTSPQRARLCSTHVPSAVPSALPGAVSQRLAWKDRGGAHLASQGQAVSQRPVRLERLVMTSPSNPGHRPGPAPTFLPLTTASRHSASCQVQLHARLP